MWYNAILQSFVDVSPGSDYIEKDRQTMSYIKFKRNNVQYHVRYI